MQHILRCQNCGKFTMASSCECGGTAVTTRPPKYSELDKYASYRRKIKEPELRNKGVL